MKRTLLLLIPTIALGGWLLGWSPYLRVQQIEVTGLAASSPVTEEQVLSLAGVREGMPLARVSEPAVRRALVRIPRIRDVNVVRGWPHRLELRVQERTPWAVARVSGVTFLVDREGAFFSGRSSAALPTLLLPSRDTDRVLALAAIADALPVTLRRSITQMSASSEVQLQVDIRILGRVVSVAWGDSSETPLKARVLRSLLARSESAQWSRIDLSAPRAPTTSR